MVDCDFLGPGTLKSVLSQEHMINWANFLHAESDVIISC